MTKRKRKPKRTVRRRQFSDNSSTTQPSSSTAEGLVLRGMLPGALMFQRPYPSWVLPHDPPRRAQVSGFGSSAAFAHVPEDERDAVFGSAAKTYVKAAHYEARFVSLRAELANRRKDLPGEVVFDGLVEHLHFELQSFAGACRTLLDELVYAIARRHGAGPRQAQRKPWETSALIKKPLAPSCSVQEVLLLRAEKLWFETLNAYRNSFFHSGWRHGWGHFAADDLRHASFAASSNGLLLPDRKSLLGHKKPHEWTWHQKTTADAVVDEMRQGLDRVVDGLGHLWNVPIPSAGKAPIAERPNMIVRLVRPALLYSESAVFLPMFSTRELGLACRDLAQQADIQIVDVPVSTVPTGQSAISLALHGIETDGLANHITNLDIVLDPVANPGWTKVECPAHLRVPLSDLKAQPSTQPCVVPLRGVERVWIWERVESRPWTS